MSKFVLQAAAFKSSGVTVAESEEALQFEPSLFQLLGETGFEELSTLFYDRVFDDTEEAWFLNIFASSSKTEAIENQVGILVEPSRAKFANNIKLIFLHLSRAKQYRFFVQTFGGPDLYR
jgi:hypothetical protein